MKPQADRMCAPAGDSNLGGGDSPGKIAKAKQAVADKAGQAASHLKSAASETATRARDEVQRFATEKKETAAGRIGGYSSAMHESARAFEEQDPNIAWFTHRAADKLQSVADYVRTRDYSGLRMDCEGLARRHPAAFFGGMFVAGLVLGNLLKASGRRETMSDDMAADWEPETHSDYMTGQSTTADEIPTAPASGT